MNEIILQNKAGQVLASSLEVAEKFGKEHSKVKRSIQALEKDVANFGEMFHLSYYEDSYGRKQEEYSMNRDGFSLIVMGFTGKQALEWKLKYIEAFNKMEQKLIVGTGLTEEEKLKLMLFSKDASEVAYAHNRLMEIATAPLIAENEELKPKAEFFDAVADSKTAISMNEVAKVLAIKGYGRNNLFEFLRKEGILDRYNVPYQRYVDSGWFRVIEQKYMKNGEPQVSTKTLVYQKGVDGIRKRVEQKGVI